MTRFISPVLILFLLSCGGQGGVMPTSSVASGYTDYSSYPDDGYDDAVTPTPSPSPSPTPSPTPSPSPTPDQSASKAFGPNLE